MLFSQVHKKCEIVHIRKESHEFNELGEVADAENMLISSSEMEQTLMLELLKDLCDSISEERKQLFVEDIHQHDQDQQRLEKLEEKNVSLVKWMGPTFFRYTNSEKYQVEIVKG